MDAAGVWVYDLIVPVQLAVSVPRSQLAKYRNDYKA